MAKVIAVMNEKGGVGKTATASSLAYLLAQKKYKTLLVDFDGQGHSTLITGIFNPQNIKCSISDLMNLVITDKPLPEPSSYIYKNPNAVDLIPANMELFALERNLAHAENPETRLKVLIDELRPLYDYIIIDCMPQLGTPVINVMICADSLIIPTQAELLSTQGLAGFIRHYNIIKENSNPNLEVEGILITMTAGKTMSATHIIGLIQRVFGSYVYIFETHIPRSIKVSEANLYHKTICEYMPKNAAAKAYNNFLEEMMNKWD